MNKPTRYMVLLPIPMKVTRGRGTNSTNPFGKMVQARITQEDYKLVQKEAEYCGVSVSLFMRWSSVFMARAIRKERDGKDYEPDL